MAPKRDDEAVLKQLLHEQEQDLFEWVDIGTPLEIYLRVAFFICNMIALVYAMIVLDTSVV